MNTKRLIALLFAVIGVMTVQAQDITIKIGESKKLNAKDNGGIYSIESYSWTTSSSHISLSNKTSTSCVVYGVSSTGSSNATITYTIKGPVLHYGGTKSTHTESFTVEVTDGKARSITVTPSKMGLYIDESQYVSASVYPSDADYTLTWKSSNSNVATVNSSGLVTGKSRGTAKITGTTDNGKSDYCDVTVYGQPESISLSGNTSIVIGEPSQLTLTMSPEYSNSDITWSSNNTKVATVDSKGLVTGHFSGNADITATTANGKSAMVRVTVREPDFLLNNLTPGSVNNASVFTGLSASFTLNIYQGSGYNSIALEGGGETIKGQLAINGSTLSFQPTKALKELTTYTWKIPHGAIVNEWGTSFANDIIMTFKTSEYEPMTLYNSQPAGYVESGDYTTLSASRQGAVIRYTLDGTEPNEQSSIYTDGQQITFTETTHLRAKAYLDGYKTPEVDATYHITSLHLGKRFPTEALEERMYTYDDVNPYIEFDADVQAGPHFQQASVNAVIGRYTVAGTFIVNGHRLVFVPSNPLPLGDTFELNIPEGAVQLADGQPNKAVTWQFSTGYFAKSISAGYTSATIVMTGPNTEVLSIGEEVSSVGSGNKITSRWSETTSAAHSAGAQTSSGMTHTLSLGRNGTLLGWGRQYCGEINGSSSPLVNRVSIADNVTRFSAGVQTSAYVSNGKLYGIGRSDCEQITTDPDILYSGYGFVSSPVEIPFPEPANQIKQLEVGDGNIFALTRSGKLYGWGDNTYGQLLNKDRRPASSPLLVMNEVVSFAISKWKRGTVAVVKRDGSLWTWGVNSQGQLGNGSTIDSDTPVKIMDNVKSVAAGMWSMAAIDKDDQLWMWGRNLCGEFGDGTQNASLSPKKVDEGIVSVSLGHHYSLRLRDDGSVWQSGWRFTKNYVLLNRVTPWQIVAGRSASPLESIGMVDEAIQVEIGQQAVALTVKQPLNANYTTWTWTTSDPSIATVSDRDVVTGVGEGQATITLTSDEGKTATCQVMVSGTADGITEIADPSAVVFDVYDLQGHKVRSRVTTIEGLPRGIYIIGGRKVVIQ